MAKFTQVAPAEAGTTDRPGSGGKGRRRRRRRNRGRRSNTQGVTERGSISDEAAPRGPPFRWPNAVGAGCSPAPQARAYRRPTAR